MSVSYACIYLHPVQIIFVDFKIEEIFCLADYKDIFATLHHIGMKLGHCILLVLSMNKLESGGIDYFLLEQICRYGSSLNLQ